MSVNSRDRVNNTGFYLITNFRIFSRSSFPVSRDQKNPLKVFSINKAIGDPGKPAVVYICHLRDYRLELGIRIGVPICI